MSDSVLRQIMATHILNFEAARDRVGRLCLNKAGAVPGLSGRVPGKVSERVAALITEGAFGKAELAAVEAVARYTDKVVGIAKDPGVELVLRDCCWQAGPKSANEVVQLALGLDVTGVLDETGRGTLRGAEQSPQHLLRSLKQARCDIGGLVSGADEKRWSAVTRLGLSLSPRRYVGDGLRVAQVA